VSGDDPEPGPSGGLRPGDVVLAIDGQTIATSDDLDNAVAARAPGATLRVTVWRAGRRETLPVKLRAARSEALASGVATDAAPRLPPGVYVESASGAALLAGLDGGDRIVAVNATPVASPAEFDAALAGLTADTVALLVMRGPMSLYVPVMRVLPRPQ
jgi:serine protease Do